MHKRSSLRNRQHHEPPSRTSSPPSKKLCPERPAHDPPLLALQEPASVLPTPNSNSPSSDSSSELSLPSTPGTSAPSLTSSTSTVPDTSPNETPLNVTSPSPSTAPSSTLLTSSSTTALPGPTSRPDLSLSSTATTDVPPTTAPVHTSSSHANTDDPTSTAASGAPSIQASTSADDSATDVIATQQSTPPTTSSTVPPLTGHLVCHESEMDRARIVNVDSWVPMDTILRLRLFGEYSDNVTPAFSVANIPSTATWGSAHQYCDMTSYLCIENKAVTASFTGTVLKKWFYDYQGNPQSPAKICVRASRAIDLAAANYWLSQTKPPKPVNHDVIWASRLMLQWPEDLEVDKPEVVPFTAVYDSTQRFADHDDDNQKTPRFFDVGDIVFVEAFITRYKTKGSKAAAWSQYQVGFELQSIDVIARNPVRPNGFSRPSVPTRNLNI